MNSALENIGKRTAVSTESNVSVPSDTEKTILSMTLQPGTYVVSYSAYFSENENGHRRICLLTTKDSSSNGGSVAQTVAPAPYIGTCLSRCRIISISSAITEYLIVSQSSGSTLTVSGQIEAVRII